MRWGNDSKSAIQRKVKKLKPMGTLMMADVVEFLPSLNRLKLCGLLHEIDYILHRFQ